MSASVPIYRGAPNVRDYLPGTLLHWALLHCASHSRLFIVVAVRLNAHSYVHLLIYLGAHSAILVDDFNSPKELAEYILENGNDERKYAAFFEYQKYGISSRKRDTVDIHVQHSLPCKGMSDSYASMYINLLIT